MKKSSDYPLLKGLFYRLLPYQILLIIINAINGIVDSLYASNFIGKAAMSSIGLYGPLNHFLYAACMMFVSGSQILYGRYLAQNRQRVQGVISVNLVISLGMSLLTSGIMVLGAVTGATRVLVDQEPELQMLNQYILGQAVGIPALLLGQQLFSFLSLENQTKRTMAASIACFVVNALLNQVFTVWVPWGTFGLGFSSALASWVFLGVQAVYYLKGKSEWKLSLRGCRWKEDVPEIFRMGYPGALSRFVEMFRCLIVNFLILKYVGSVGLSSFAASNSVMAVIWPIPFGMVAVARMLFSISLGEEDRRTMVDTMRIVMTHGMMIVAGIVAFLFLAAEPLTQMFYRDISDPVYGMTVSAFRILPLCMPFSLTSLVFACYTQVMEKKTLSILIPVIDGAAGVVLFSLILIPGLKMNGLYIANICNGLLCLSVITAGAWASLERFPRSLEDLMAIPARFGVPAERRLDLSVRSMDEVMDVSRQITAFCEKQGIDSRKAYFAGLCMEEMAGNVVTHGFGMDRKKHSVDIRVACPEKGVILRIRDDCAKFNPFSRLKVTEESAEGKNVGIRLAHKVATETSYQHLLGMNVVTLRF